MKQQAGTSKRELSALKEGHSREIENLQRQLKAQQEAHAQEESSMATRHAEQVILACCPSLRTLAPYNSDCQPPLASAGFLCGVCKRFPPSTRVQQTVMRVSPELCVAMLSAF